MSKEESKTSLGLNPTKEEVLQYMGKRYSEISRELDAEIRGERPFKCGWFERKVKGASMEDENRSDDEKVVIFLKEGRRRRCCYGNVLSRLAIQWAIDNIQHSRGYHL